MQFRERRRVIQVIRTIYDPAIKRGRSEVVGRLDRDEPVLDAELRAACAPDEVAEIEAFLSHFQLRQSREGAQEAATDLPTQMRLAEIWFRDHADGGAAPLAAEVWTAWGDLSKALRKAGTAKQSIRDKKTQ